MSRVVQVSTTLVEYDGPQVVLAEDQFGTSYVGVAVDRAAQGDTFLLAAASRGRLRALLSGQIDLRAVFAAPETTPLLTTDWNEGLAATWLEVAEIVDSPEEWLPSEGFLVSDFLAEAADDAGAELQAEAIDRNRGVVRLSIGPPGDAEVEAENLSTALHSFQQLLKQGLQRSVRDLDQKIKNHFLDPDQYELVVFGFSPGSFRVHLEAKALPDLFGGSGLERAFARIDQMAAAIESTDASLEAVRQNHGHLASAYMKFLEFVAGAEAPVRYSWTTPAQSVRSHAITPDQAALVLEALGRERELGSEWVQLEGTFVKVNTKTGSWTLEDADGREHSGSLHEDADDILSGVVVKETSYQLVCEEVLAETIGSGRSKTRLLLQRLSPT